MSDNTLSTHVGKIPPARLQEMLKGRLGRYSKDVIVGPGAGLDCARAAVAAR